MTITATIETEGAQIAFDHEGAGPALLLISGGGGDAARYAALSQELCGNYKVIRYDRRCASRSTGDRRQPLDMAQQARDAKAVLNAAGAECAFIFGNSGGGAIALKLAEDHPQTVTGLVVHEPSLLRILPDRDDIFIFMDKVEDIFRSHGEAAAMQLFGTSLVGLENLAPHRPETSLTALASDENLRHFMSAEYHNLSRYEPDFARLRGSFVKIIATAGRASGNVYYARTSKILAQTLGCPYRRFSGHHVAFLTDPALFAAELRVLLRTLAA